MHTVKLNLLTLFLLLLLLSRLPYCYCCNNQSVCDGDDDVFTIHTVEYSIIMLANLTKCVYLVLLHLLSTNITHTHEKTNEQHELCMPPYNMTIFLNWLLVCCFNVFFSVVFFLFLLFLLILLLLLLFCLFPSHSHLLLLLGEYSIYYLKSTTLLSMCCCTNEVCTM